MVEVVEYLYLLLKEMERQQSFIFTRMKENRLLAEINDSQPFIFFLPQRILFNFKNNLLVSVHSITYTLYSGIY